MNYRDSRRDFLVFSPWFDSDLCSTTNACSKASAIQFGVLFWEIAPTNGTSNKSQLIKRSVALAYHAQCRVSLAKATTYIDHLIYTS